jgi:hypothetical protein
MQEKQRRRGTMLSALTEEQALDMINNGQDSCD